MLEWYNEIKDGLEIYPFILIIAKYDQILGPKALLSSYPIKSEDFIENLLRDALNTTNKYVRLDFKNFYSHICKVKVKDPDARGGYQSFAIILLRHIQKPVMAIENLIRIEQVFLNIDKESILKEDNAKFMEFFRHINDIYLNKKEIFPIESLNLKVRSSINTIQGFCQLLLEKMRDNGSLSEIDIKNYINTMLESCKEVISALEDDM
jgi:hypothetical protein